MIAAAQRCSRCHAPLLRQADGSGWCVSCGEEDAVREIVPAREPETQDWTVVAIAQLRALLAEIDDIDHLRAKAERIERALRSAEVAGIPELPWRRKATSRAGIAKTFPACGSCGRQFTNARLYVKQPDGTARCRDGCPGG